MGGEQAATVLTAVASEREPAEIEALRERTRAQYETQGHPYHATARLWDDGVIDPLATRDTIGLALSACANAPLDEPRRPVLRM
jgi:3-methylcrotonyl-CoA carboxylase beta subunit